jgi:hypothetical protein
MNEKLYYSTRELKKRLIFLKLPDRSKINEERTNKYQNYKISELKPVFLLGTPI